MIFFKLNDIPTGFHRFDTRFNINLVVVMVTLSLSKEYFVV